MAWPAGHGRRRWRGPRRGLPVTPLKGQIVHLVLPSTDSRAWPIVQPVLGYYLVPWPDGRVACGGTMEAEAGFDHRPTADGVHQLLRECLRTAPGLAQATVVETRVGSRPATADGRPVVGPVPGWANAFVATGHGAEGLLLGPYSALVVARMVLGGEPAQDPIERASTARVLAGYGRDGLPRGGFDCYRRRGWNPPGTVHVHHHQPTPAMMKPLRCVPAMPPSLGALPKL